MKALINLARRFKPFYPLYNYFQKKQLQHVARAYDKLGLKKKYYSPISSKDFVKLEGKQPWLDRYLSKEKLPQNANFKQLKFEYQAALQHWSEQGYAILRNFYDLDTVAAINEVIEEKIASKNANWKWRNKIVNALHDTPEIYAIAHDERLTDILTMLLGKTVYPIQSLNFITGSQQATHSDSIHMTTFPLGYLIAVWIALEDVEEGSGLLHYYPKSHQLPYILSEDYDHGDTKYFFGKTPYAAYERKIAEVVEKQTFEKQLFKAKKGDLLIWHANLLHGGEPVTRPNATRKSMVLHYFVETDDVVCYHEVTQRPALVKF
ncbi:MAG: phytanoyl-CoA dioxygenase family protein [Saprospiraceae bacterium]